MTYTVDDTSQLILLTQLIKIYPLCIILGNPPCNPLCDLLCNPLSFQVAASDKLTETLKAQGKKDAEELLALRKRIAELESQIKRCLYSLFSFIYILKCFHASVLPLFVYILQFFFHDNTSSMSRDTLSRYFSVF